MPDLFPHYLHSSGNIRNGHRSVCQNENHDEYRGERPRGGQYHGNDVKDNQICLENESLEAPSAAYEGDMDHEASHIHQYDRNLPGTQRKFLAQCGNDACQDIHGYNQSDHRKQMRQLP